MMFNPINFSWFIILCVTLALSGCSVTHIIDVPTHAVTRFELVDMRPQDDKETSYSKIDGKYNAARIGDSLFVPDRLEILKSLLDNKYGVALNGKRIEVVRFRTMSYMTPRTNLDAVINEIHGFNVYPGTPDPRRDWWIFEISVSMNGILFKKTIFEEIQEVKFCPSCYRDLRSRATINALNEFVTDFGQKFKLQSSIENNIEKVAQ